MQALIDVFRMTEVSPETRAKIIMKLGRLINDQWSMNITQPLVYELVLQLDPENQEIQKEYYTDYK